MLDNLPGYPDNLMRGHDGRIWVGLFKPRNPAADKLADKPFLRKILCACRASLLPLPSPTDMCSPSTRTATSPTDLQDPTGAYPETTGVTETADRLYIHSLHAHGMGWLPR